MINGPRVRFKIRKMRPSHLHPSALDGSGEWRAGDTLSSRCVELASTLR